jgi:raffinose/stachyose/melibiose transport system substrate-binding protein
MKNRITGLVVLILLIPLSMSFATGSSQSGLAAASAGEVTINMITWRGDDKAANDRIIANFNAKYPNIKVNFEYDAGGDTHHQLLRTRLLANEVDMYAVNPGEHLDYINNGYAQDLTGQAFLNNYIEDALYPHRVNGKLYGASQATSVVVVYYNVDIFKANNVAVPKSWSEFLSICETLKSKGIAPVALGAQNVYIPQNIATPLMGSLSPDKAPQLLADAYNNPAILAQEPMVTVNKCIAELQAKGYFAPGYMGVDKFGAAALLAQGKAAMCIEGSWRAGTLEQTKELNWDIFFLSAPGGQNTYISHPNQAHYINPGSRHLKAVLQFYEFASSPESLLIYSSMTSQMPTGKGVTFDSPTIKKLLKAIEGRRGVYDPVYNSPKIEFTNAMYEMWHRIAGGENMDNVTRAIQAMIPAMK